MRKITLLLSIIFCAVLANAQIIKENFSYATGNLIDNGWVGTGATPSTTNPIQVTAASISYTGYPDSGVGNEITLATTGQDLNKSFTAIATGTIYFSALVNVISAQTGDYFLHIGDSPTGSSFFGRVFVKLDGTNIAFGVQNTSGTGVTPTYTASSYSLNTNYLVVGKVNAATGESSVIVNPDMAIEPTSGWITSTLGTLAVPAAGFATINIRQGGTTSAAALKLDGIRVATSWSALFSSTNDVNNPSASKLSVSVANNKLTITNAPSNAVEIFNTTGAKVLASQLINGSMDLNLAKGAYIVRSGNATAKIIL